MGTATHRPGRRHLVGALLILIVIGYVGLAYVQPFAAAQPQLNFNGLTTRGQSVDLAWPSYGESAIGAAGYGVLAQHNNQRPMPTASIAKVVTALAVLQQHPLEPGQDGPAITIGQADIDSYKSYVAKNGSVTTVSLGETISEYQALQALLLPSSNNMAETLARWAFGSLSAYNDYANEYVHGMGLGSMQITDPSGFLPTTVASAHDLTMIGQLAMLNPVISNIVAQPSATIPVQGVIKNYNFLLGQDHNIGIKTGNNDEDPGAYLFAYRETIAGKSVLIVGAIMGGPDLATVLRDTRPLVQSSLPHFSQRRFVQAGDVIATYQRGDQSVKAVAASSFDLLAWDGQSYRSAVKLQTLRDDVPAGKAVGTITITDSDSAVTDSVPVVLHDAWQHPSLAERLRHPF